MKRAFLGAILAVGALVFAALGAAAPAAAQTAITLGLLTSMTGPAASTGEDQRRAAALAVDEVNAAGGVLVRGANAKLGRQLVIGDDQPSREGAVSAVTRLLVEDKVQVVFGGLGSAFGMAALPQIREHAVPYIPTPSTPLFTRTPEMGPDPTKSMVFHYQATGLMQGATIADFLVRELKPLIAGRRALRVAWMYQDSGLTVRRRALPWLRGTGEGRDPADRGGRRRALQGGRDGLSLAADEDQGARSRRSRAAGLPRRDRGRRAAGRRGRGLRPQEDAPRTGVRVRRRPALLQDRKSVV